MGRRTRTKKATPVPVDATEHPTDTRTNIPTAELESFAAEAEREPKSLLYPRDPSLDPQLVWRGKDEQDRQPLEVPAVPIYIQETIEPRALVEDLRAQSKGRREEQVSFFEPFEGMEFAERVDFYQHEGKWTNRMILGDSLLVMASLAEKEGLKGRVQMIYMDPPYGIRFGSNWQVSTRKRDVKDGKAEDTSRQPEQVRAFRDTWELGVHSYLSYLRDRLAVARDLLTESGSIFVQIGDENVHLVRSLLDEVFGRENFVVIICYRRLGMMVGDMIQSNAHYLVWYARDKERMKAHKLFEEQIAGVGTGDHYTQVENERPFRLVSLTTGGFRPNTTIDYEFKGKTYHPGPNKCWRTTKEGLDRLAALGRIVPTQQALRYKQYLNDFPFVELGSIWVDTARDPQNFYVVQTPSNVIKRCVLMTTDPGDLALDPTCGSGTTAYVAEEWGRRWITIDTSRVAVALARGRLMTARYPYFLLADSLEGQRKEAELTGRAIVPLPPPANSDVRKGFVYERVPHVTLKSIAQNPDIHEGMSREEVDVAIRLHAETEMLYDRPYRSTKVVRVSGPFTVESLSPHRVLTRADEAPDPEPLPDADASQFVERIIENLQSAGVQNTVKGERLQFDRLEIWPGVYVQAAGDYTESGKGRTVAVCIGPEHGTVGTELVREAAKEAVKFADLLVVCGFAFEALVGEEPSQLGRLTILKAKMNPDLGMPGELLKKTGAANLFMVFGEPDISIEPAADDMLTVEIRGLDVYDPTTGQVRSHSTDDIACWFVDTNYDAESFFVRHAYFLGADDPYDRLKRALRADIDEEAWSSLYRTKSRPFPKPETGKIAIKVINHYGDEILKVLEVR